MDSYFLITVKIVESQFDYFTNYFLQLGLLLIGIPILSLGYMITFAVSTFIKITYYSMFDTDAMSSLGLGRVKEHDCSKGVNNDN